MAIKAIYTKIGKNYFKVNQDCSNPRKIFRICGTHSQMSLNPAVKQVDSSIWINPINLNTLKTNKEAYDEMIEYFVNKQITEIPNIQNRYILYMDYTIFNENGIEVNHNVVTKEIEAFDMFYPLGVDTTSELIYKQIKVFESDVSFVTKNCMPMGIMRDTCYDKYTLKINDISVFQDLVNGNNFADKHYSANENCYACHSKTIGSQLRDMQKIFSTYDNGLIISAVEVPFIPRKIVINLHIALDNTIVVYDDAVIRDIIAENIYIMNHPNQTEPIDPSSDNDTIYPSAPDGEKFPESDGDYEPINGKYDYYARVASDTVGALRVVEDELVGDNYDTDTMIHKSMVTNDIPDIEINDYVKYFNVEVMSTCIRLNGGTATD